MGKSYRYAYFTNKNIETEKFKTAQLEIRQVDV